MATKALGVLAHVPTLRARLWRRDQPGEHAFVATNGSLILPQKKKKKKVNEKLLGVNAKKLINRNLKTKCVKTQITFIEFPRPGG